MFIEGIRIYQMIVDVFGSVFRIIFRVYFIIGYGIPALIIAIALIIIWLTENYILFDIDSDYFYL
jgi:ABC-type microcin C transport system permease subunit YejB